MTAEQLRMSIINEAFTGDWESVSLGEVCVHENGDRGKNYPSKDKLGHEGIPFISALNLANNTIIDDDKLFKASEVQFNNLRSGHLKKGDFVVCIRGSIGKHGIYPFEKGAIASSLVILRPDENKLSLMWLSYYFDSGLFQDSLSESQNGTAQPNLGAKELMKFELPLPPLAEQKRIVAKLEELLPIVEQYGKAQKELDELNAALPARLRQSILQEAISGRLVPQDPNDEPIDKILNTLGVKTIESEEDTPAGWSRIRMGEATEFINGLAFKPEEWKEAGLPIVRIQNLSNPHQPLHYTDKEIPEKFIIDDGQLLFSWSATLDAFIWNRGKACLNQHIFKLVPQPFIDKIYLYYLLKAIVEEYKKVTHGSTMKHITKGIFENYEILLPPLAEQQRIVAKIEELFAEIDKLK